MPRVCAHKKVLVASGTDQQTRQHSLCAARPSEARPRADMRASAHLPPAVHRRLVFMALLTYASMHFLTKASVRTGLLGYRWAGRGGLAVPGQHACPRIVHGPESLVPVALLWWTSGAC